MPSGLTYTLQGLPEDTAHHYFKISLYNKFGNTTGTTSLNQFVGIYYTRYYMSVPRKNIFDSDFTYEMYSFNLASQTYSYPI
jgi:hypothetical protein